MAAALEEMLKNALEEIAKARPTPTNFQSDPLGYYMEAASYRKNLAVETLNKYNSLKA